MKSSVFLITLLKQTKYTMFDMTIDVDVNHCKTEARADIMHLIRYCPSPLRPAGLSYLKCPCNESLTSVTSSDTQRVSCFLYQEAKC